MLRIYTRFTSLSLKTYLVCQRYPAITPKILWISGDRLPPNLLLPVNKNESYSSKDTQPEKKIGKANDLSERPGGKPSTSRSRTHLPRPSRRTLNILRTSTPKLLHHQRKAIETHPHEKRQELVARNRHRNREQQTDTLHQTAGSLNLTTLPINSSGQLATSNRARTPYHTTGKENARIAIFAEA